MEIIKVGRVAAIRSVGFGSATSAVNGAGNGSPAVAVDFNRASNIRRSRRHQVERLCMETCRTLLASPI